MNRALLSLALVLPLAIAACSAEDKQPVESDFSDLAAIDQKSDAFSYRMKILGSLDYGQTSTNVKYTSSPRYRAYKFAGGKGDVVDVWTRSSNGGDAVTWLLDNAFHVVASNDDADAGTLDSHVSATLPGNTDPAIRTYYVVYRDYSLNNRKFAVSLNGAVAAPDLFSCNVDADCVALPAHSCCGQCLNAAVNKDQVVAYQAQPLDCGGHACTVLCRIETRVAQCNTAAKKCEMIEPTDIVCGGHTINPHRCPASFVCDDPGAAWDAPGKCVSAPPFCGGIANIQCPAGLTCIDDPTDDCDNSKGGADCGGICVNASSPNF